MDYEEDENSDTFIAPRTPVTVPANAGALSYYVRAKAAGGVQNIEIQAYDSNNQPIGYEYDMVTVNIQDNSTEGISDWVIPSGWTINGNSFKTSMPVNAAQYNATTQTWSSGAIGPRTEGTSIIYNKGDAFMAMLETLEDGFTLSFNVAFDPTSVLPDTKPKPGGDEQYTVDDLKKLSFVANSGVKFGALYSGSGSDLRPEINLLDMIGVVEKAGGLQAFLNGIQWHATDYFRVECTSYGIEPLSKLLPGVMYGGAFANMPHFGSISNPPTSASLDSAKLVFENYYNAIRVCSHNL